MEYFESLEPLLRYFWYIAIPVSIIFLIQVVLTFFGSGDIGDMDTDFDSDGHDGFHFFSFRNLINFLLGFSWAGILFYKTISNPLGLLFFSLVIGLVFVFLFFAIIKQIQKLSEDNSFKIENTIGKTAEVYLKIPGNKLGKGKIMISINGAYHELEALTTQNEILTGSMVKIVRIENNSKVLVEII